MQIGEHLAQFFWFGRHLSRQRYATRRGSVLRALAVRPSRLRPRRCQRLVGRLLVLAGWYGVCYCGGPGEDRVVGVGRGRVALFAASKGIGLLVRLCHSRKYALKD